MKSTILGLLLTTLTFSAATSAETIPCVKIPRPSLSCTGLKVTVTENVRNDRSDQSCTAEDLGLRAIIKTDSSFKVDGDGWVTFSTAGKVEVKDPGTEIERYSIFVDKVEVSKTDVQLAKLSIWFPKSLWSPNLSIGQIQYGGEEDGRYDFLSDDGSCQVESIE